MLAAVALSKVSNAAEVLSIPPATHASHIRTLHNKGISAKMLVCRWTVEDLAVFFKVRQQRVMAIIALKEEEKKEEEETGKPLPRDIQYLLEGGPGLEDDGSDGYHGIWQCDQVVGVGERHVKMLPRSPNYEVRASYA